MPVVRRRGPSATVIRSLLAVFLVVAAVLAYVLVRGHGATGRTAATATPGTGTGTTAAPAAAPALKLTPTDDWIASVPPGKTLEGFASRTSVLPGGSVDLRVSASAPSFTVSAFRMGSYDGKQAALAWHGGPYPTVAQPAATETPDTRTVTAPWQPTATVTTTNWPPGAYLLRLEGSDGASSWVPLTVRSPSTAGKIVLLQGVTDWQAYNAWGGRSLYHGRDGKMESRAYAVSFDRPYEMQDGAGDFLGNELPLVTFAEGLRIPIGYATDVDLHDDPHLLDGALAVVSPGHDEYYSTAMRDALTSARDAGTNIFFLGANAIYRHIRLSETALGPNRLETDYKDAGIDPMTRTNPSESTPQWRVAPLNRPESDLVGGFYQCNPGEAQLVVAPKLSWLTEGLGLAPGQRLGKLVGPEYDRVDLTVPTPHPLQVIFHSPIHCTGQGGIDDASDVTYYTTPSGAAVFDSGTSKWECALDDTSCQAGWGDPATFAVVREVTKRLLMAAAEGPIGRKHPAVDTTGGPPGPGDGIAGITSPG